MLSGDEGPAEIMVTEFAHRVAETLCSDIGAGETHALELIESMGTPELADVFTALTIDLVKEIRRKYGKAHLYNPAGDPMDVGHALAVTILQYACARDLDGITTAVAQAQEGSRRLAALRFVMWNRSLWDGELSV